MAKVLVVKAHPFTEEYSRTIKVTNAFIKSYKEHHPDDEVEELNLYDLTIPEIDRDLLDAWGKLRQGATFYSLTNEQQHKVTLFDSFTASFMEKDKVVIANPLWNLSVPTRLKAWIDTVTVAGKTFKYTDQGSVGLLEGRKALHIQSNGTVYSGSDPASQYVKLLFTFLGFTDYQQLFAEGMDQFPDKATEIMDEVMKKAIEMGRTF